MTTLTAREVALLDLLTECGDDFGRAHDMSMALGNPRDALYRVALKMWPDAQIAAGNFPLLLSPSDLDACAADTCDGSPAWIKMDSGKMLAILRARGLPEEYIALLERDRLAAIDTAGAQH